MAFTKKHALVSGASRGIGRGIALKLAELGAKVGVHYYKNEKAAQETLSRIRELGSDGFVVQGDITQPEDISKMFGAARSEFGSLDIFISNARPEAGEFFYPPMDITLEQWDKAFDSQAKAFLVAAREAAELLRDGGQNCGTHLCGGEPDGQPSAMGRNGIRQGGSGDVGALFRRGAGRPWHYGQRNQSRMDRRHCAEHFARRRADGLQELAWQRVDPDEEAGHARGHWRCRVPAVCRRGPVDHGTDYPRRRRGVLDESGSSDRDSVGMKHDVGERN